MRLFGKLLAPWRSYGQTVFRGDWAYRLEGLFESGIDFSGKRILDAGCNVGIVAYEVAKQGPASIHGVDYFPAFIETARHVFQAIDLSPTGLMFSTSPNSARSIGSSRPNMTSSSSWPCGSIFTNDMAKPSPSE